LIAICLNVQVSSVFAHEPDVEFFERNVLPILEKRCFACHSHAKSIKAGLALDSRSGWDKGGDSGPAVVPGDPGESLLIIAVDHEDDTLKMPPKEKLSAEEIETLKTWVRNGAADPRKASAAGLWESAYRNRLDWWSLKPVQVPDVPRLEGDRWSRTEIDRFVVRRLKTDGVEPAPEADRRVLARRLSFVLTGLPLEPDRLRQFALDTRPDAYERLVDELMTSPHFGERWARHWMDVVHYSDTHGYEWDVPAKNAWMYRDYLVRAFSRDLPVNRLILEQIAGDIIEPRMDPSSGTNESIMGPMAMRLGERRHGDNAQIEGVTQEAMANIVDTVSKSFMATTVACAQCHDHKLDAVEQKDYYAWTGMFMSTRWGVRQADIQDPNLVTIAEMRAIKNRLRLELGQVWAQSAGSISAKLKAIPVDEKAAGVPDSIVGLLARSDASLVTTSEFQAERNRRIETRAKLKPIADFTKEKLPEGWSAEGFGMKHGLASDGEFIVAESGSNAIQQVLSAGRYTHTYSQRLGGLLSGPMIEPGTVRTFSIGYAGGRKASQAFILDHCFHSERMAYPEMQGGGWLSVTAGNFDRLSGPADTMPRRVYLELATKAYNNYFPPRTGYGGVKGEDESDPRSWFGVTRIYEVQPGEEVLDTLGRFVPIFENLVSKEGRPGRDAMVLSIEKAILDAARRWSEDRCDEDDAKVLDEAVKAGWLTNEFLPGTTVADLVDRYREAEKRLVPDRTIGTAEDRNEARNEPLGLRGSYTEFGEVVHRGNLRYVKELLGHGSDDLGRSSGRAELAASLVDPANPLTARVYVNRVWQHVFGEGLVRTPDDFGHLGEKPSHPELLDYLASRFMAEGWSTKRLIREMVRSAVFRQSNAPNPAAYTIDPENRLLHHYPHRRLDAESLRDSLLTVSGRLDRSIGGQPVDPHRTAEDPVKRLVSGPLDGHGRRSIYQKITLMEPPKFLAIFNQPLPKLTTGKRDRTTVPDQALAMMNDPFVLVMAEHWAKRVVQDTDCNVADRAARMFENAVGRPPSESESRRLSELSSLMAEMHGVDTTTIMSSVEVWKDVAHAIFNLKEFAYVR
jgi:hypothetical protein